LGREANLSFRVLQMPNLESKVDTPVRLLLAALDRSQELAIRAETKARGGTVGEEIRFFQHDPRPFFFLGGANPNLPEGESSAEFTPTAIITSTKRFLGL
jgi:hypothetical protein